MDFTVRKVAPEQTFALRHRVLRSHEPIEALRLSSDEDPRAANFAALDGTGEVVGTAVVFPEPPPWDPGERDSWRLRGMATAEDWRSRGVGSAVLTAVVDHVADAGGCLLWCNARLPAVKFYERAGFERIGAEWEEPFIGPHVALQLKLPSS
jgi:GNAT superfamily N-acetyltransferase